MAKKKGSKKKAEVGEKVKSENQITALEKEMFTNQVKELETRLDRQIHLCQILEEENRVYQSRYEKEVEDKEDIVDYLKRSLQDRSVEITELQERLNGLQNAHQIEKDNYEKKLKDLAAEYAETRERLTAENMTLNGKLALVEEFRFQKDVVLAKLNDAEREAAEQSKQYESKLQAVENQKIKNLEALKKEMVERVENLAAEFRTTSEKQLSHTVRQAVNETARLNAQLKNVSDVALSLTETNRKLKDKESDLKHQLQIKEDTEHHLSLTNQGLEKVVSLVQDKCGKQIKKIEAFDKLQSDYDALKKAAHEQTVALADAEAEIQQLTKDKEKQDQKLETMEEELAKQSTINQQLSAIIQTAEKVIKYEVMSLISMANREDTEVLPPRRDSILQQLLILLDTATSLEDKGASLFAAGKDFSSIQERYAELVLYEPGSLGLIYVPERSNQSQKTPPEDRGDVDSLLTKDAENKKPKSMFFHDTAAKIMSEISLLNRLISSEKKIFT